MNEGPDYVLGFAESEQLRLARQDRLFARFTRALLEDAGLEPGMEILDLGAGVGDVSMLAAELVGPRGSVLGIEQSPAYVAAARRRAEERGLEQLEFIAGDLFEVVPERSFDAIIGRFVLEWIPEPTRALRQLVPRLRPGGIAAFQDYDHPLKEGQYSHPPAPLFERILSGCIEALVGNGLHRRMGSMLRQTFINAGLPAPSLRVDVSMGGGPDYPAYEWLAAGASSLRPALADSPIAEDLREIDTLADRIRAEVCERGSVVRLAPIVGAWARKV